MQAILELIATVVIWMAVATLDQFGVKVDLPRPEPRAERVIHRESAAPQEAADQCAPCPDDAPAQTKPAPIPA